MKNSKLTREELYELVWNKPISQLAMEFGFSDKGLAKNCARMEIPVPGRGYWAKLEHGYTLDKEPLEEPSNTCQLWFYYNSNSIETAKGLLLDEDPLIQQAIEFDSKPENTIVVQEKVHRFAPVVKHTIETMRRGGPHGMYKSSEDALALTCSKSIVPRAARIYQALIQAFEKRGYKLGVHSYQPYINSYEWRKCTSVEAFNIHVHISLCEKTDKVPIQTEGKVLPFGKKYDYVPNGKLILRVDNATYEYRARTYWSDTSSTPLEEKLNTFVLEVIKIAVLKKHKKEAEEEEERLREEQRRRREEESERRKHLDKVLGDWEKAEKVRAFINALQQTSSKLTFKDMPQDEWVNWAKSYADQIDPLILSHTLTHIQEDSSESNFWREWARRHH